MVELSGLIYPERFTRALFTAMTDVMGQHGVSTLLELVGLERYHGYLESDSLAYHCDFAEIAALNLGLEGVYGARGGRGMALRIGRGTFAQGIRDFGAMKAVTDPLFRSLPLEKQLSYGLNGLAHIMTNFSDQRSWVVDDGRDLTITCAPSPFAWERTADRPVCHMMVGIIQECLRWSTDGREFYVREVACHATGSEYCVFQVNKTIVG